MTGAVKTFSDNFQISIQIIGQMALSVLVGYWLVRRKVIDRNTLTQLTRLLVDVLIPSVFFVSMTRSMNLQNLNESAVMMGTSLIWTLGTLALCTIAFKLFPSNTPSEDRAVTAMAMVHNGIYLPLPVILALTPPELKDKAAMLLGMTVLPTVTAQWTISVNLMNGQSQLGWKEQIRLAMNAPLLSLVFGSIVAFIPSVQAAALGSPDSSFLLKMIFNTMSFIGGALSPIAMIVLGAFIGSISLRGRVRIRHLWPLIGVRLLLLPAIMVSIIHHQWLPLTQLASLILIVEAAAPPATNHSVIARRFGGEWELVSSIQLVVHAVALVTLSFWITLALQIV